MSKKERKKTAREKVIRRRRRGQAISVIYLTVGFMVIAAALFFNKPGQVAQAVGELKTENITQGDPLHAIHEMSGSSIDSIKFLPKDGPQPIVAVSEAEFDFGKVGPTKIVTHEFIIQNVGDAPLTINRAYTTCGCTTADFTATVIPPGKGIIMTLVFDAGYHDVSGQIVRRGVIIEINDPNLPQLEIWTQANILNR
jgi:hypothetical protein